MSVGWEATPSSVQQPLEIRVVAVVEDDEARVHVPRAALGVDPDRVGVAARIVGGLEQRRLVSGVVELGGGDEAGDAAADDRDSHRGAPVRARRAAEAMCQGRGRARFRPIADPLEEQARGTGRRIAGLPGGARLAS